MLSACTGTNQAPIRGYEAPAPSTYRVQRGDTLYAIAFRFGLDYRDVAAWNQLASPDRILAGQTLRLTSPSGSPWSSTASLVPPPQRSERIARNERDVPSRVSSKGGTRSVGSLAWGWPAQGKVVRTFDPDTPGRKGIQIGGSLGQPIKAASAGVVVYSGSGLPGYGRLIILKHPNSALSAYAYLGRMLVREGDSVKLGQTIAEMGSSSDNRTVLHFEIREDGKPVDPLRYLPN